MIWIAPSEKDALAETLEQRFSDNLQRATRLRQSILQKAFTGELK